MTKLYLTYFFVLLAFLTNAQNLTFEQVDSLTTSIIAQLLQEQDSVLLHEFGCVGCYFISDYGCNCKQYNSLYWRDSSNTRIQKIDCCGAQEPSTLDQNVWSKFELDAKDILNSKFKTSYYVIHHA
ncbi:MAG: hypothetical protein RJQ14_27420, partial [Marinoscillum sp.]